MKILRGGFFTEFFGLIIVCLLSIFVIYKYRINVGLASLLLIFIAFIYLLSFIERHYFFKYDNDRIVVKNSWLFAYYKEYKFTNISSFEVVISGAMGIALQINFSEGRKKIFPINVKRDRLEEMVKELNDKL